MSLSRTIGIIEGIQSGGEGQDARFLGEFLKMSDWNYKIYKSYKKDQGYFLESLLRTNHRFLHISAHGDKYGLELQNECETYITSSDVKKYVENIKSREPLKGKFLTISACGHVSGKFISQLHKHTNVTAVISALSPVGFAEAALFSALFYFSLASAPGLSKRSESLSDDSYKNTSGRMAQYIDAYQRAKNAYLAVGGTGAHRLDYWWEGKHIIVN